MAEATNPITTASNPRVGEDWVLVPRAVAETAALYLETAAPRLSVSTVSDLRKALASAPSPEAGAGGDLGELERLSAAATQGMARAYMDKYRLRVGEEVGRECCIPDAGEPSFVLLGRDPQAPYLVERWAYDRERAEPDSPKPAMARQIAAEMRAYKLANPERGLQLASAPSPDPAGAGGDLVTEDDAEIERIMSLSSDELRAELAAEGHDPDQVLENAQRGLDGILRLAVDRKRWRDEAASWRRVAERLEEEKQALRQSREAL